MRGHDILESLARGPGIVARRARKALAEYLAAGRRREAFRRDEEQWRHGGAALKIAIHHERLLAWSRSRCRYRDSRPLATSLGALLREAGR